MSHARMLPNGCRVCGMRVINGIHPFCPTIVMYVACVLIDNIHACCPTIVRLCSSRMPRDSVSLPRWSAARISPCQGPILSQSSCKAQHIDTANRNGSRILANVAHLESFRTRFKT